jgi:nucleoside-diphosphate-sugar epimerase
MPVIVVGADTPVGEAVAMRLASPGREVRAFVTAAQAAVRLRAAGIKVACGDVSDESHLSAACNNCFTAVLVVAAAYDDRERAFAGSAESVLDAWAAAVTAAAVRRVIWVGEGPMRECGVAEQVLVQPSGRTIDQVVDEVLALDEPVHLVDR